MLALPHACTQLMNKMLVVGLMFSFALPILYGVIALYLWSAHWVDRYSFLRRVRPDKQTDMMMEITTTYLFPIAIVLHSFMATRFLRDICHHSESASDFAEKQRTMLSNAVDQCTSIFTEESFCVAASPAQVWYMHVSMPKFLHTSVRPSVHLHLYLTSPTREWAAQTERPLADLKSRDRRGDVSSRSARDISISV